MRIWTECYRPFIMGGDVHRPIATEVEPEELVKLGRGVAVAVIKSPKGTTHIAELKSGAFVGTDLAKVKEDFKTGDKKIIARQIKDAIVRSHYAEDLSPAEFWGHFRSPR